METIPDEQVMLDEYGITCEKKVFYIYKKFRYSNLIDAVKYAKLDRDEGQLVHGLDPIDL